MDRAITRAGIRIIDVKGGEKNGVGMRGRECGGRRSWDSEVQVKIKCRLWDGEGWTVTQWRGGEEAAGRHVGKTPSYLREIEVKHFDWQTARVAVSDADDYKTPDSPNMLDANLLKNSLLAGIDRRMSLAATLHSRSVVDVKLFLGCCPHHLKEHRRDESLALKEENGRPWWQIIPSADLDGHRLFGLFRNRLQFSLRFLNSQ